MTRKRLYTGVADLALKPGFKTPQNRGYAEKLSGDGAFVRLYTYASNLAEAETRFRDALESEKYCVQSLDDVEPNRSNKLRSMDCKFISVSELQDASKTGVVLFGWFISYG